MQLSIIIPAYNESQRLPRTLGLLETLIGATSDLGGARLLETIVVDDGSRDETALVVRQWHGPLPLRLLQLPINQGKGAAARTGMLAAAGDLCLLYDADAATPVGEIANLVQSLRRDRADIAIGSRVRGRHTQRVSMQFHRRLIGRVYHWLCSGLIPGIDDAACGAKLFTRAAAQDLFSRQKIDRFAFDIEVLALAMRRGYVISEIPVRWEAVAGSKINLVRDTANMSWCVLKLYARFGLAQHKTIAPAHAAPAAADVPRREAA